MTDKQPDLWFSFVRAHRAIIKKIETQLSEAGLPAYAWYDVLWGLESGENGTRRMHELADVLVIERYNLTRLMDRLEKERLVTRFRSDDDRRASFATITEEGKALRKKCGRSTARWSKPTFSISSAKKRSHASPMRWTTRCSWPERDQASGVMCRTRSASAISVEGIFCSSASSLRAHSAIHSACG